MNINETKIAEIVDVLMDDYNKDRTIDEIKMFDSPEENVIIDMVGFKSAMLTFVFYLFHQFLVFLFLPFF